ncbi:unnamed protein product [Victoria cruziana]
MKLQALRNLDAFPRAEEHLLKKTQSGGVVSVIGLAVMALLFIHELKYCLAVEKVHQMSVDVKRGETLPININMSFPSLPCDDDSGEHKDSSDHIHDHAFFEGSDKMVKDVKRALENGEGCRIVPTEYRYLSKEVIPTNQFSVSEYFAPMLEPARTWPAVYFLYDMSPITVAIMEVRHSFLHFITRLCAVLGGTFAMTGMLDRWMYRFLEAVTRSSAVLR